MRIKVMQVFKMLEFLNYFNSKLHLKDTDSAIAN